jgi:DNA polymerase-1
LVLQVHDELLFEVPKDQVEDTAKRVKNIMENVFTLSVPIQTEAKVGSNWGEMKKLEI